MKKNKLLLEFSMGMPGVVVCGAAEGRGLGLGWTGRCGNYSSIYVTNYGGRWDGKWSGYWIGRSWVRLG